MTGECPQPVPAMTPVEDYGSLRRELKKRMPAEAFRPQPLRGVVALVLTLLGIGIVWVIARGGLPWWACLSLSFVLGQMVATVSLTAHEAMHHSVFRNKFLERLVASIGFAPLLLTPGTWSAWHAQHHSSTNVHVKDPDILPTQSEWKSQRFARFVYTFSLGSRSWASHLNLILFFTVQTQLYLWYYPRLPQFRHLRFHKIRERVLTGLIVLGWGALGWALGARGAFYGLLLPHLFASVTLVQYFATNHFLQPASAETDNPFVNTASLDTHPLLDWMHLNFSYHQEHHIFPAMSSRFAPLLRKTLREINPEASIVYPHLRALRALYARPPLYAEGGQTFVAPEGASEVAADDLRRMLESTRSQP
jgi:fatty acid desaturase